MTRGDTKQPETLDAVKNGSLVLGFFGGVFFWQQSWPWKMAPFGAKPLIFPLGPIFHFQDDARKSMFFF